MFKIKKKLIISICLLPALLSGCRYKDSKPVHIFSAKSTSDAGQTQSPAGDASESAPEQSSELHIVSFGSSSTTEQEPPVSSSTDEPEPPENDTQTVIYNYDPKNSCTVTFDGESITVTGIRGDVFEDVLAFYPEMDIARSLDNGILTCVMTPQDTDFDRKVGSFAIIDTNQNYNTVYIDLSDGSVMFPDTSELVRNNSRAVSSVVDASEAKVAQYITLDGSRDGIPEILGKIKKISDGICAGIADDYEKLRAISRWVSDNIYYDHPIYNLGAPQYCLTLEYMLENRSSICGGYSNMTSALCAAQGIRCLNITGMALNDGRTYLQNAVGEYHEWNVAEIGGRQIIVDTGWNSRKGINSNGSLSERPSGYMYFDIGEDVFSFDHKAQTAEYRDYWALAR